MRLKKVISGGQTGADRAGLDCAKHQLGLETGGTVPRGCRTESGSDPTLVSYYGCIEDDSYYYPARTRKNVQNSDVTLWFGRTGSPGYKCTANAAHDLNKPFYINPTPEELRLVAENYEIANIAGNRKSTNPGVVDLVDTAFKVFKQIQEEEKNADVR